MQTCGGWGSLNDWKAARLRVHHVHPPRLMDLSCPAANKKGPEPLAGPVLQLKIRLLEISPMIWRRVLVPASYTLEELHGVIQVAMGWESLHLYQFWIRAVHYGVLPVALRIFTVTAGVSGRFRPVLGPFGPRSPEMAC